MKQIKKPDLLLHSCGYCGGCGHGIIQRLIAENIEEMGLQEHSINVVDIACCFWSLDALDIDGIAGPHGRCAAVATGMKKCRPEDLVFIHAGDGASYTIGLAETMHAAMRDVPITMIVVNNGIFGMTGGQMALATTLLGDKTVSTPKGRDKAFHGNPGDILQAMSGFDVQFLARGALYDVKNIINTKKLIRKGFEYQMAGKGFSLIEILSPCPTNWGLSPIAANEKIRDHITQIYPVKIYADRQGE